MTHAWTHAWCKSPARDEAVRAAEDGRAGPLPTLKECIVAPFADAAERPVPVSKTGEGQSGMRTERITLEVKHGEPFGVSHWSWVTILRLQSGESVRVVEDGVHGWKDMAASLSEYVLKLTAERDAAIRERDEAVAESERRLRLCETMKRDGDSARFHAAVAQARVAELEAASGGGEQEPVAWAVRYPTGRIGSSFDRKEQAEGLARNQGLYELTVVPLYASPPQPRGWLTDDEREAVQWAADAAYDKQHPAEDTLRNILARLTPPEVRLVRHLNYFDWHGDRVDAFDAAEVLAALAAAGVEVEEVGRE